MTRAAAKNHAWVTIVTEPRPVRPAARGAARERRHRRRRDAARASRSRRSRAPPRTTPRSCSGCRTTSCCPQHLVLALDRTDETLRYGENPHQHGARYRRHGTTSWWDGVHAARRPRALVPQLLRRRRGVEARARPRRPARVRDHQAREPVRRRASTTTSPTRTSARSSATSAPRSAASSRSTVRSTPRPSSAWSRARRPTS